VYRINIEFVSSVSRELLVGLYASNYTTADGETRHLAVTDLEATDARRVFPCFDEPAHKATFDVSVIRQETHHALSNMDLLRTEPVPSLPGWVRDTFNRTEKMSTYLFAIAVSDFESEDAASGLYSKPVKVWGPPPYIQSGAGKYSPDVTAKLMASLESYFQVDYTFPKMDKFAVPHFSSGAMENWGLNTYRLNRLLIEDGIATVADRVSAAITLSHELVHQWFGNLVTMKWWDDLYLNEGFASYYSNTAVQDIGLEDMLPLDTLVTDSVQRAMQYDVTNATHPIHYSVETPTEIRIMFDTITYSKGASIVRMMNAMLTEPVMRTGLTDYLKKFSHSNANQDDLFETLQTHIPEALLPPSTTLKTIMDDWTLQTGFPVVSVTVTTGAPTLFMLQEKYRPETDFPADTTTKWHIPITLQFPTDSTPNTTTKVWMLKSDNIAFVPNAGGKWVIVNPQQTGYYRVRYNEQGLKDIVEQLHTDHTVFDAQTRSMLVDDNLNLGFAGYMPLGNALNLTMYLEKERDLVPWNSFFNNMGKAYTLLLRSGTGVEFKKYILRLVTPALEELKLDPQPNEPIGKGTILRTKLFEWACNSGHSECISYSLGKFREWKQDPSNNTIIFPDLRPHVYCTAIANGDDSDWEFALAQYKLANREVTKTNLLRSLACSRSSNKLNRLLGLAIDLNSGIDDSHRLTAIQAVVGNSGGVDVVFNFVRNLKSSILNRFGASFVANIIVSLSNSLHKSYDVTDLETFIRENESAFESVKGTLEGAVGNILANVRWMQRNLRQFDRFVGEL
jgi:aminopeptidase N